MMELKELTELRELSELQERSNLSEDAIAKLLASQIKEVIDKEILCIIDFNMHLEDIFPNIKIDFSLNGKTHSDCIEVLRKRVGFRKQEDRDDVEYLTELLAYMKSNKEMYYYWML